MGAPTIPVEQAALLGAIVAHPDEDTPRLIYADWLQENGDTEQAQFIRDSVRLAPVTVRDVGWVAEMERLEELAYEHGDDWVEALGISCSTNRFERGLPIRVTFDGGEEFLAMMEAVFALLPIRELRISAFGDSELDDDSVEWLAGRPELARLTELILIDHPRVSASAWQTLFNSPHLSRLEYLSLHGCGIGPAEAEALAYSPALPALVDLDLSHNSIGDSGARAIFESPHLTHLEQLWLQDNFHISDEVRELLRGWLGDGLFLHSSPDHDEDSP
jgi:uncharacterized protein (TIGR02996 family)